jgi:DNA-binding MarR family transcriptional regulator
MPFENNDHVDHLRAQWALELPDLDTAPMAVLGRMYRLSQLVGPSIERTFSEFGLDRGEFDVLSTLRRSGPPYRLTPTDLYRSLLIPSGSLTHRLTRLEAAGLVARRPSPTDGRSSMVELTEEGRQRVEQAFRCDMSREAALLADMSQKDIATLAALLRKLTLNTERRMVAPSSLTSTSPF